jgi:hypothetical protein
MKGWTEKYLKPTKASGVPQERRTPSRTAKDTPEPNTTPQIKKTQHWVTDTLDIRKTTTVDDTARVVLILEESHLPALIAHLHQFKP